MPTVGTNTRLAMYLFCEHLEQNGLYHTEEADEGYHYDSWVSPTFREIPKVYTRSGAKTILGDDWQQRNRLVNQLEKINCVVTEAGEVSLASGHWRRIQAQTYGYDDLYQEGGYSVPATYIPSINLASETYEAYRRGTTTRDAVAENIRSTSAVNRTISSADGVFDAVAGTHVSRRTLFRVLHAERRFPSGVNELRSYVVALGADGRIPEAVVEEAVELPWDEVTEKWRTHF